MEQQFAKETLPVSLEEEMRKSYLDYAMSVIVGRALPDADQDGIGGRRRLHLRRALHHRPGDEALPVGGARQSLMRARSA